MSFTCEYPDNGLFTPLGRITDNDGGFTDYTVEVLVNNLAPVVGPITAPSDPAAVNLAINASADFTDAGMLYSARSQTDIFKSLKVKRE